MPPTASCPACAAPVSPRAATCALCDHVIDPSRIAAATRAADRRPSRGVRAPGRLRRVVREVVHTVIGVAIVMIIATIGLVTYIVRQVDALAVRRSDVQAVAMERMHTAWPRIDAAATQATEGVRAAGDVDRSALRELLAGLAPTAGAPTAMADWLAAMDADTTAWLRYGRPVLVTLPSGDLPARIVKDSLPARLPDSLRLRLVSDTASPWLGVFRRVAVSPAPPAAWSYRAQVPGARGPMAAPMFGFGVLKALSWGNGASALLALDAGDRRTAVQHARENVAVAHLLIRTPSTLAFFVGRQQLRASANLLAHVGRLARDSAAIADAAALSVALDGMDGVRYDFGPSTTSRDPRSPTAAAIAGDMTLPPAIRVESAIQVATGSCLSVRETLTGPAAARQDALDAATARLADLDPEQRLRPLVSRTLTEWRAMTADGGAMMEGWTDRPAWSVVLTRIGLGGVAGRAVACSAL